MINDPLKEIEWKKQLNAEDLWLEVFEWAQDLGWQGSHKFKNRPILDDAIRINPQSASTIKTNISIRVKDNLTSSTVTQVKSNEIKDRNNKNDDFFAWFNWEKKTSIEHTKKSVIFDDFFDDEDSGFVWPMQPELPKIYTSRQVVSDDIIMVSSEKDLEKAIKEAWWYYSTWDIGTNVDISNQADIAHLVNEVPIIYNILSNTSIAIQHDNVTDLLDNDKWKATLKFIENPDHFDIVDSQTKCTLYSITDVKHDITSAGQDPNYAVTSIGISNWVVNWVFNIEINNANKLSCIATNMRWEALSVYFINDTMLPYQEIAHKNLINSTSKTMSFESFLYLLNSWYYTKNLDRIFNPKKSLQ